MKISNDPRIDKEIRNLQTDDRSRVIRLIDLFSQNGFNLNEVHLKKLTKNLWELRSGKWRLLFGLVKSDAIVVNMFIKKTQKTPKQEIDLALHRLSQYQ